MEKFNIIVLKLTKYFIFLIKSLHHNVACIKVAEIYEKTVLRFFITELSELLCPMRFKTDTKYLLQNRLTVVMYI